MATYREPPTKKFIQRATTFTVCTLIEDEDDAGNQKQVPFESVFHSQCVPPGGDRTWQLVSVALRADVPYTSTWYAVWQKEVEG